MTEPCKYWVRGTMELRHLSLNQLQNESRERERKLFSGEPSGASQEKT